MLDPRAAPESTLAKRPVPVRAPRFALDAIGRGWLATDPIASDVVDALSMIFPEGERFFIRSVVAFAARYEQDLELRARVRGFVGQEGRHGHEHERMNRSLAARGHDVAAYDRVYRAIMYGMVERVTPKHLSLASTAALEHMTATLAEVALTTSVLDDAPEEIARLLRWHALEEIGHRSVAFDVLQRVDPRLRTRAIGLAIGLTTLTVSWTAAFAMLRFDDRGQSRTPSDPRASRRFWKAANRSVPRVLASVRRYLDRDFHPDAAIDADVQRACAVVLDELSALTPLAA